jgi:acetyl-CoA carboxylase biotin carboxyl carrier protein
MSADLPLSPEDVTEIVAILDGTHYQSLNVSTARFRLRVAREGDGWSQSWDWTTETPETVSPTHAPHRVDAELAGEGPTTDGSAIRAPLPGTFYRSPQPGAPPYVSLGDDVGPETVVGIIETMKLMNPVYAGVSGRISSILVGNAEMVDGDAVIMRLA